MSPLLSPLVSRRTLRWLAAPLCAATLTAVTLPSSAAPSAGGAAAGATPAGAVRAVQGSARGHFGKPRPAVVGVPGGVRVQWAKLNKAKRYRVKLSSAPYGKWPITTSRWLPGTARSLDLPVGNLDYYQSRLAYGNPIFAQLFADTNKKKGGYHQSKYVLGFPAVPEPAPGMPLSLGSFNTSNSGGYPAIGNDIADRGLQVVSLQETTTASAGRIASLLGPTWKVAEGTGAVEAQIIYNDAAVNLVQSGAFGVSNYSDGGTHIEPWARFAPAAGSNYRQSFYVVAVHFTVARGAALRNQNQQTGSNARQLMGGMAGWTDPVIVAGDMTSNREPFRDQSAAQPTFVRSGYYDASAAQNKVGYQFSTYNANKSQAPTSGGVGTRADYILIRGFEGTVTYQNVVNYPGTGSDHNLIWSSFRIPQ